MSSKARKEPPPKRKANGYKMPGRISKGEILKDISNNKWEIHTPIGIGGFGEIYSASKESNRGHQNYVIKIEPCENGPLFCEKTVYLKIGKKEDIEEYMKLRKLKSLGMPRFYGCGTHTSNAVKYRFLVMERYGRDLWSLFLERGRIFPGPTVFRIGIQVLDVLEYIHSKLYIHADIKGANLLLGLSKASENQVFLVDFGLAARYATEFKPNPKKAHNGTLEYTSRDAHVGVPTRRGDIEILGYNMLQWVSSSLPWEKIKNPSDVESQKIDKMKDCKKLVNNSVKVLESADVLLEYFQCLCNMQPLDDPNYNALRRILSNGASNSSKLQFTPDKSSPKTKVAMATEKVRSGKVGKLNNPILEEPVCKRTRRAKNSDISYGDDDGNDDSEDDVEELSDGDMFKTTPPNKKNTKRSWKDAPTVVSCAEVNKLKHSNYGKMQKRTKK